LCAVILCSLLLALFISTVSIARADTTLEVGIPGGPGSSGVSAGNSVSGPAQYINYIYIFVLGFVAIAGLVTIVIWGTVWTISGIVDQKARAMEGIKNALIGIGIAFVAFVLLYTINPDLTTIKFQSLQPVKVSQNTPPPPLGGGASVIGGVAACCFNPGGASGPGYQWACVGENELTAQTGCSRIYGAGWQTFGALTQGCVDASASIGAAPTCSL